MTLAILDMESAMQPIVSARKDNVISVLDPETLDVATAHQIIDIVKEHVRELRRQDKQVYILVDTRQVKHDSEQVREIMFNGAKNMDFDRMAILGANYLQAKTLNMLLLAASVIRVEPNREKIKLFKDEQSAELWLQRP